MSASFPRGVPPRPVTFIPGDRVAIVGAADGKVLDYGTVSELPDGAGDLVGIEGYTATFSAASGNGHPLVEKVCLRSCAVYRMDGTLLLPATEVEQVVRSIPATCRISHLPLLLAGD